MRMVEPLHDATSPIRLGQSVVATPTCRTPAAAWRCRSMRPSGRRHHRRTRSATHRPESRAKNAQLCNTPRQAGRSALRTSSRMASPYLADASSCRRNVLDRDDRAESCRTRSDSSPSAGPSLTPRSGIDGFGDERQHVVAVLLELGRTDPLDPRQARRDRSASAVAIAASVLSSNTV